MNKVVRRCVYSVALLLSIVGSVWAAPQFLTVAGGPVGGEWYILGGILAEIAKPVLPETKINATTGGAVANLTSVQREKVDLATTQDQLLFVARKGEGAFTEAGSHEDVVGLAYLSEIYMGVFLVREDYAVNSLDEIVEKKLPIRILTAPKGSSPSAATERMLAEYGITPEKLKEWGGSINYVSYAESSSLISDGHADAYCGPIMPATIELSVNRKLKVLPVSDVVLTALNEKYKYGVSFIPGGSYSFIPADTKVFTESPILVVNRKMDEDVAYKLVKAIAENYERIREAGPTYKNFSPEKMSNIIGGPVHPGAAKFYRDIGLN